MVEDFSFVLKAFGIDPDAAVERVGSGHINRTFKVTANNATFILQQINTNVFADPEIIARNLQHARDYLTQKHPDYLFIAPIGQLVYATGDKNPWRLYPYIENTFTVDDVQSVDQAYEASKAFGRFGRLMKGCDLSKFKPTIDQFHNLALRYDQFIIAYHSADATAKRAAANEIEAAVNFRPIVDRYNSVIASRTLVPGIFHNDTKINNVLFDRNSKKAVAVIDLDTVMEGYFIYDLGDLVRTIVSPVSEEEKDLEKIAVRKEFYHAIIDGYLSEMGAAIRNEERLLSRFAGVMMTYIMALRFLADFLRGNTYYHITYPDQNLVRARNQLRLIELLELE